MRFVNILWLPLHEQYVQYQANKETMTTLSGVGRLFKHFPVARYPTDVTFQPSLGPSGRLEESKKYFSGKHKQYGYKIEVSVLLNGMAIGCREHEPGSVSDLTMFRGCITSTKKSCRRKGMRRNGMTMVRVWTNIQKAGLSWLVKGIRGLYSSV